MSRSSRPMSSRAVIARAPATCARLATAPALEHMAARRKRVNQDRSPIAGHAEMTSLAPGDARSRLEMAVELLRREWRDGCPAGMAYQTALGSVRRLRPVAASEQIADDLSRVIDDLGLQHPPAGAPSGRAD